MDVAIGFAKSAGLRSFVGRVVKGVGRAVGSKSVERSGFKMQYAGRKLIKTKGVLGKAGKARLAQPRMKLIVPHDADRASMSGRNAKVRPVYTKSFGTKKAASLGEVASRGWRRLGSPLRSMATKAENAALKSKLRSQWDVNEARRAGVSAAKSLADIERNAPKRSFLPGHESSFPAEVYEGYRQMIRSGRREVSSSALRQTDAARRNLLARRVGSAASAVRANASGVTAGLGALGATVVAIKKGRGDAVRA